MPRKGSNDTMVRQWEMLTLLSKRAPGDSARTIHQKLIDAGFSVTIRTVERDLKKLSATFPLRCDDSGKPEMWRWMDGAQLDLPAMNVADAVSLSIVRDILKPLLPVSMLDYLEPRFDHAEKKLEALSDGNAKASWINKVRYVQPDLPLTPPVITDYVLEIVQEGLMKEKQVVVEYLSVDRDDYQEMRLHPLGLVVRGQITYLVARAFNYEDIRLFALHRIAHADLLEESISDQGKFDIDDYINEGNMHFGNGKKISIKLKTSPELTRVLTETALSEDMKIEAETDQWSIVHATIPYTQQLVWWIRNWANYVEVLEPTSLKESI